MFTVFDTLDHIKNVTGADHIGIGSDFDGSDVMAQGMDDVSKFPLLFAELLKHNWTEDELEKLAFRNFYRVFKKVEEVKANSSNIQPYDIPFNNDDLPPEGRQCLTTHWETPPENSTQTTTGSPPSSAATTPMVHVVDPATDTQLSEATHTTTDIAPPSTTVHAGSSEHTPSIASTTNNTIGNTMATSSMPANNTSTTVHAGSSEHTPNAAKTTESSIISILATGSIPANNTSTSTPVQQGTQSNSHNSTTPAPNFYSDNNTSSSPIS